MKLWQEGVSCSQFDPQYYPQTPQRRLRQPRRGLERPKAFAKNKRFTRPTPCRIFCENALTGSGAFIGRVVASIDGRFGVAFFLSRRAPPVGLPQPPLGYLLVNSGSVLPKVYAIFIHKGLICSILIRKCPPEGALRGSVNIWNSPPEETSEKKSKTNVQ